MRPINILLYEDNPAYRSSFKLAAQKERILTEAHDNVDTILETLEGNPRKHKFVVLDARAYLHEGQAPGTENEANLHKIFREIDRIAKAQARVIPYCINTGFADIKLNYQEVLPCPIFEKGEESKLFEHIWKQYNNTDAAKVRQQYPEVFSFADTYFDEPNIEVLTDLLLSEKFKSNSIAERVSNLATLRRLIEHTMDCLFVSFLHSRSGVVNGSATRAGDILHYLKDLGYVPPHIFGATKNIMKTASNFGSHTPEQALGIQDYPTNNSIIGLTFGFFDIINWAQKLLA